MRRPLCCSSLLLLFAGLVAAQDKGPALAVGKDLPGTFHPYNITARAVPILDDPGKDKKGPVAPPATKGKFHCLISEYNLDPVILFFARGLEDNKAFAATLKTIDQAIEKQPGLRLRCFVVFLDKGLTKVMEEDTTRAKLVKKIEGAFAGSTPKQVVLTLAGTDDVKKYDLDATMPLTAVLYQKLRVKALHKIHKDGLASESSAALQAVLKDAEKHLGAKGLVAESKGKSKE
jgi:hypothetical protein